MCVCVLLINSTASAVLATLILKERLGPIGIIGCLLSLIGAVIIVLHAPEDPEVASVEELVNYMLQPGIYTYRAHRRILTLRFLKGLSSTLCS